MAKAFWNGELIAESDDIQMVENNLYFPRAALKDQFFQESNHHTTCGWKGEASYLHLEVQGKRNENAAWFYPDPKSAAENIRGRVAFWKGVDVQQGL